MVLPGKYTFRLNVDEKTSTTVGEVLSDPRTSVPLAELEQNVAFTLQARTALERLTDDIEEVRAIRAQTLELKSRIAGKAGAKELEETATRVIKRCDVLESRMHNPEAEVVYDVLNGRDGGAKLYSQIAPLFSDMQSSDYAPTQGQKEQMDENLSDLQQAEQQLEALRNEDLAGLEAQARALGLPRVILPWTKLEEEERGARIGQISPRTIVDSNPRQRESVSRGPCAYNQSHSTPRGALNEGSDTRDFSGPAGRSGRDVASRPADGPLDASGAQCLRAPVPATASPPTAPTTAAATPAAREKRCRAARWRLEATRRLPPRRRTLWVTSRRTATASSLLQVRSGLGHAASAHVLLLGRGNNGRHTTERSEPGEPCAGPARRVVSREGKF